MVSLTLPCAATLFLLLAPLLAFVESPISLPPASTPTASPIVAIRGLCRRHALPSPSQSPVPQSTAKQGNEDEDDKDKNKEECSSTPVLGPAAAGEKAVEKDEETERHSSTPMPAPVVKEMKAAAIGDKATKEDREKERHVDELNSGKKQANLCRRHSGPRPLVAAAAPICKNNFSFRNIAELISNRPLGGRDLKIALPEGDFYDVADSRWAPSAASLAFCKKDPCRPRQGRFLTVPQGAACQRAAAVANLQAASLPPLQRAIFACAGGRL
uniref:Uncharacterized protein n=1 Tax=Oryza officinalis TaxID=4535 RepID=A0A1V1H0X6_9ORYZ|nr:hypothetical protein [Oryza officinalis]